MAIVNSTTEKFVEDINKGVVLVDFWAPWCAPCKMIAPVLGVIDNEMGDKVKIVKVNVDQEPKVASQYGIMGIPTLMIFKEGAHVQTLVGFRPKDALVNELNRYL